MERKTITYGEIADLIGLPKRGNYMAKIDGIILDEINRHEHSYNRPMLSAVVVRKNTKKPGPGFFKCARSLGKLREGEDEEKFWRDELESVYKVLS